MIARSALLNESLHRQFSTPPEVAFPGRTTTVPEVSQCEDITLGDFYSLICINLSVEEILVALLSWMWQFMFIIEPWLAGGTGTL